MIIGLFESLLEIIGLLLEPRNFGLVIMRGRGSADFTALLGFRHLFESLLEIIGLLLEPRNFGLIVVRGRGSVDLAALLRSRHLFERQLQLRDFGRTSLSILCLFILLKQRNFGLAVLRGRGSIDLAALLRSHHLLESLLQIFVTLLQPRIFLLDALHLNLGCCRCRGALHLHLGPGGRSARRCVRWNRGVGGRNILLRKRSSSDIAQFIANESGRAVRFDPMHLREPLELASRYGVDIDIQEHCCQCAAFCEFGC